MIEPQYVVEGPIKSLCEHGVFERGLDEIIKDFESAQIVVWLHHAVFTGKVENNDWFWHNAPPEGWTLEGEWQSYLEEMRVFNEDKEWYIWKASPTQFRYRLRKDNDPLGEEIEHIDQEMPLRGSIAKQFPNESKLTLNLQTRNYVGYNTLGQAGFEDSRFLNIK